MRIIKIQINDILILVNNNFANTKEKAIKLAKIMIKNRKHLTFAHSLKFNNAQIKLDSNSIVLTKNSHVDGILLITDHDAESTSSIGIIKKKPVFKKLFLA